MIFSSTSAGHNKPKLSQLRRPITPDGAGFTSNYTAGVQSISILAATINTLLVTSHL